MASEMKPCPFCGSKEENPYDHTPECYLHMLWSLIEGISEPSREDLLQAWNTRAERTVKLKDNGHCPDCNRLVGTGERYCAYCGAKVVE